MPNLQKRTAARCRTPKKWIAAKIIKLQRKVTVIMIIKTLHVMMTAALHALSAIPSLKYLL